MRNTQEIRDYEKEARTVAKVGANKVLNGFGSYGVVFKEVGLFFQTITFDGEFFKLISAKNKVDLKKNVKTFLEGE